jgi:MHS family shikimate/dehydroshikimate transporter-like MFS transporter
MSEGTSETTTGSAGTRSRAAQSRSSPRKVIASVVIGTTIEWYDFTLYGAAAATVIGPVFFPSQTTLTATLLSFSTFAVAFVARPVGAVIVGHFGDRIGRKKMLVLSLAVMGLATFVIGLIPSYGSIGVAAPIVLVLCRMAQGFGVGGEWGGAVLNAVEHAPPRKRAFYGSLPQVGVPAGLLLSTFVLLAVSQLPEDDFLAWGWRIPFLGSIVLLGVGMYIRRNVGETPAFQAVVQNGERARFPALTALARYPGVIALTVIVAAGTGVYYYSVTTYSLSYASEEGFLSRSQMLVALCTAAVVMIFALLYFGRLAQRLGRHRLMKYGFVLLAIWIFPVFWAIETGSLLLTTLAFAVHAVVFSVSYAALSTYIAERFAPAVRFSAASIAFQVGALLGSAFTPLIAVSLTNATGSVMALCFFAAAAALVGLGATVLLGPDPVVSEEES